MRMIISMISSSRNDDMCMYGYSDLNWLIYTPFSIDDHRLSVMAFTRFLQG